MLRFIIKKKKIHIHMIVQNDLITFLNIQFQVYGVPHSPYIGVQSITLIIKH